MRIPFKRALAAVAFFEQVQYGHLFGGPLHAEAAAFGEVNVGYVVVFAMNCGGHL